MRRKLGPSAGTKGAAKVAEEVMGWAGVEGRVMVILSF